MTAITFYGIIKSSDTESGEKMITIPEKVRFIIQKLEKNGFEAYAVGGCIRDSFLGITPDDWDITTSAKPEDIKKIFSRTFDTGIKHGTISILLEKDIFEVTTFRHDGEYKDNRHPEHVTFTTSVKEDLARRDFTVNAMAYNETRGLVDPFGGQKDLKNKIIRCVGEADKRFTEDALRILRAVRFTAQKGFCIEGKTLSSIQKNASLVQNLSVERIVSEITKILLSDHLEMFDVLYETDVLSYIMPELCSCFKTTQNIKWHIYDVGHHTLCAVSHLEKKPYLRYAMLMHDWGKPLTKSQNPDGSDCFRNHAKKSTELAENWMNRYRFSNSDKDKILRLIKNHDREIVTDKKCVKRAVNAVGDDIFIDLLNVKRADAKAQNFTLTEPRLSVYDAQEALYYTIKENNEPFSVKNLDINGHDLIALGYQGKEIGNVLNQLLEHILEHPEDNKKEILIQKIKE